MPECGLTVQKRPYIVNEAKHHISRNKTLMQVILHIGVHCTDEDRLIGSLMRNEKLLEQNGTAVPNPNSYRNLLRETLFRMAKSAPKPDAREIFLNDVLGGIDCERLILSNENFICQPQRIFENGQFYRLAPRRLSSMQQLMQGDELEVYMAVRNPATFLSAAFGKVEGRSFHDFIDGMNPLSLRWSDVLWRMRAAVPKMPITVWCNEDTPLIWSQLIRDISGLEHGTKLKGGFAILREIMSDEGMLRFRDYLHKNPPQTEVHQRRVIAAFLDKYALEDEIEEELALPGLTEQHYIEMTEAYEEDLYEIEKIPGVTLITP